MDYDHNGDSYAIPTISILYPANTINSLPEPHKDLPKEFFDDYEEARSIAHCFSSRCRCFTKTYITKTL